MAPPWVTALVILFSLVLVVFLVREIRQNNARRRMDAEAAKRLEARPPHDRGDGGPP